MKRLLIFALNASSGALAVLSVFYFAKFGFWLGIVFVAFAIGCCVAALLCEEMTK